MNTKKFLITAVLISALAVMNPSALLAQDGGGTVSGKVSYKGPAITPQTINFGAEKQCAMAHDTPPVNENIVINPDGTVQYALVYIKEKPEGDYPVPADPVIVDQVGCMFIPHAVAVRVGQPVEYKNSDDVLHNVRSVSKTGQSFNIAQPIKGMKTKKTFKNPEIGIPLKCDVHFWMAGYIHALDHPFFAMTGDDGSFTIKGLPDGDYELELWHEKLGTKTQNITIKEGEAVTADFELE